MRLTEKTIIKKNNKQYDQIIAYCHKTNNLYNATLYDLRQYYFNNKKYKKYSTQVHDFTINNNPDYRALPTKISKQTMRIAHNNMASFFALLKKKNNNQYNKPIKIPQYKPSGGLYQLTIDKESINKKQQQKRNHVYEYPISKTDMNLTITTTIPLKQIKQVRIIPKPDHFVQEVVYEVDDGVLLGDNGRYASLDLGVNNAVALYSNCCGSLLYNGGPVKSVNQFYNKRRAVLQSKLPKGVFDSKALRRLALKRNNRIVNYFHEVSASIVSYLVSNRVNTLVIGYNREWKQGINIGGRNNQNFVMIPFLRLVRQLVYKCALVGISVVLTGEGYTSKTSFLDRERSVKHGVYVGCRVRRGLFRSKGGVLVNADVNGGGQILRKVVPDDVVYSLEGIEGCRAPHKVNIPYKKQ